MLWIYLSFALLLEWNDDRRGSSCPLPAKHSPRPSAAQHALHGGCPVKKGTKWVMTRWIRDKSFGRIGH